MKKELSGVQKGGIIALFFLLVAFFCSLIIALLPKQAIFALIIVIFIIIYILYDKVLVQVLGLEMAWWSPHAKRLDLTSEMVGRIDPEIDLLAYFISNDFKKYHRTKKKKGFKIGGKKGEIALEARLKNNNLRITFTPYMSKNTIREIKKFKKYLAERGLKELENNKEK